MPLLWLSEFTQPPWAQDDPLALQPYHARKLLKRTLIPPGRCRRELPRPPAHEVAVLTPSRSCRSPDPDGLPHIRSAQGGTGDEGRWGRVGRASRAAGVAGRGPWTS